jgi:hypothetical protein
VCRGETCHRGFICCLEIDEVKAFAAVHFGAELLPPFWMIEVPLHSFPQARLERFLSMQAKFALDLARIYCVLAIVSWPVRNKCDQVVTLICHWA